MVDTHGGIILRSPTPPPAPEPPPSPLPPPTGGGSGGGTASKILHGLIGQHEILEQIFVWQILGQVISALTTPEQTWLQQLSYKLLRPTALDPADAAAAVRLGNMTEDDAVTEMGLSGVNADRAGTLLSNELHPPATADIVAGVLRGTLSWDAGSAGMPSASDALKASGLDPKYVPLIKELARQLPSWNDALNAELEGQLTHDDALAWYTKAGGDPDAYQWLFDTNGQAPTPAQALELLNRGIIPENGTGPESVSYEQAFLEGPWRNKWLPPFLALREYLPPPRTVVAMLRDGSLSDAQASTLLQHQGLTKDLAAAYINDAHTSATKTDRELTEAQVITLYEQQLIAPADATNLLTALGFSDPNAKLLLALADLRREIAAINSAVSRIQSLYIGHKINRAQAQAALSNLQIPADQISAIVQTWDTVAGANVRVLTESQVADAFQAGLIDQSHAMTELEAIGYQPHDAWTILSLKMKKRLPGEPPPGASPTAQ